MHKLFKYIATSVLRKYIIQFVFFFIFALLSFSIYLFTVEKNRMQRESKDQVLLLKIKNEILLQQVYLQLAVSASYGYAHSGNQAIATGLDVALDSIQASTLRMHSLSNTGQYKAGSRLVLQSAALVMQKAGYLQLVKRMYDNNNREGALNLASGMIGDHLSDSIQKINSAILDNIHVTTINGGDKFPETINKNNLAAYAVIIGCFGLMILMIYALSQYAKYLQQLNIHLEGKVDHITTNLSTVNNEMETFTFSVSKYMKAPMRAINRYADILKNEYGSSLDEFANGSLNILQDSAGKVNRLIDMLMKFSQLEKTEISQSSVDMNGIVQDTLKELSEARDLWKYNIIIKSLPPCKGESNLLKEVWQILADNAIKFSRNASVPEIEIGCKTGAREMIYYVTDNGVGFDMIYQDKLFGIFQRLHRKDEFEGAGLGLSLVKRIVEKHGGRVFANSVINKGTTISFTLPTAR